AVIMLMRIMNMTRETKRSRAIRFEPHEPNSDHLSRAGREPAPDLIRGRPERPDEGDRSSAAKSAPSHSTRLPAGERENAAARLESVDREPIASSEHAGPGLAQSALYRLITWLSPAYPVGAFSYSSGLEWAVEAGDVTSADALAAWLAVVIGEGGGFCDAVLFAHAHRAATALD